MFRWVGDCHGHTISKLLLLISTSIISHEFIVLHFLLLKPLGKSMHCALPLCLIQLGMLLYQEDARAQFLFKVSSMRLTRVVGMLRKFLESSFGDCDALTLWVVITDLESLT